MHIVIDDTYGPKGFGRSKYVTGDRRTYVAVIFEDKDVDNYRKDLRGCLEYMRKITGRDINEFHFVDIYNRYGVWKDLPKDVNLVLFEAFAHIYSKHRWPVLVQTVDKRTVKDCENAAKRHGFEPLTRRKIDGLDLSKHDDFALFLLSMRIRLDYAKSNIPLTVILDDGRGKPGRPFGDAFFRDRSSSYLGFYASSKDEPLLQIADLLAFCINRSTHLALKDRRTEIDTWFLELLGKMRINSINLVPNLVPRDFTVDDFDQMHRFDREIKGLQDH